MCYIPSLNNKINRLHEGCFLIVHSDKKPNFEELFKRDGFVSIHHQNIRFLAIEIFKVLKRCRFSNCERDFSVYRCTALPNEKTDRFSNPICT